MCTLSPDENRPPVAKAGGDRVVLLPVSMVALDGSASSDDRGIASYLWERDSESLASGVSGNETGTAFKVKVIAKVQNVSECLSEWYLLNHRTFCYQHWYSYEKS